MTTDHSLRTNEKARRARRRKEAPKEPAEIAPTAAPTKLDRIVSMLSRPEGTSLAELVATTGWQAHSVRGALAGSLKRKGYTVLAEKSAGERRYRVGAGQ